MAHRQPFSRSHDPTTATRIPAAARDLDGHDAAVSAVPSSEVLRFLMLLSHAPPTIGCVERDDMGTTVGKGTRARTVLMVVAALLALAVVLLGTPLEGILVLGLLLICPLIMVGMHGGHREGDPRSGRRAGHDGSSDASRAEAAGPSDGRRSR